jgi:5,5'-dehydrodivanillate O-demethylase
MISKELNDRLTQLGPGTPLGSLLRRYWLPITAESTLDEHPVQRIRVLGEDLVLFRDESRRLGLVAESCPHRGASLANGFTEKEGLRCPYHGWLFAADGTNLDMPNQFTENLTLRAQCGTTAFAAQAFGGMIFANLGSKPLPVLPKYDLYAASETKNTFLDIGWSRVPCNWLQIMENSLDPTHVEWLHGQLLNRALAKVGAEPSVVYAGRHVKIGFDRFEHGIIKRRLREGQSEDADDWAVGHPVVWPYFLKVGGGLFKMFQMRTPIDDENTLYFWYVWYEVPDEFADIIDEVRQLDNYYYVPLQAADGSFLMDTVDSQDAMVWATQGRRTDRDDEHLCAGDEGVSLFRKLVVEQIDINEAGGLPMGITYDDPGIIDLPMETSHRGLGAHGETNPLAEFLRSQSKYSPRLKEAARLIDQRLGIERDSRPVAIGA